MRRFQSPLLKIHSVCEQQSRLAEIELARVLNLQRQAEQQVDEATTAVEVAQSALSQAMRTRISSSMLLGIQGHLIHTKEKLEVARTQVHEAARNVHVARETFQKIQTQVDGLSRQLDRQRADYRKEMFKEQQSVMDDGSISRWTGPK